jgi:calcineurin-like phosphoesterase family protein
MNTFVIADTHFGHADIILHCKRPWCMPNPAYDTLLPYDFRTNNPLMVPKWALEAHDQFITEKWNKMVTKKDRVIIVGDFAFKDHLMHASSLNGRKILVMGNHDDDLNREALKHFDEVYDFGCVKKMMTGAFRPDGKAVKEKVTFCHYAMRAWPGSWESSASVHAHSHGRMPELDILLSFDVGMDVWGYFPIPWEAIQKRIEAKRIAMGSKGPAEYGDGRAKGSNSSNPDERVLETRARNLAVLASVGITVPPESFSLSEDCVKALARQREADKVISSVVAVAGAVNRYGRAYSKDSLQRFADGKRFFWNEESGSLVVKCRAGLAANPDAAAKMFKDRLSEVAMSTNGEDKTNGQDTRTTV